MHGVKYSYNPFHLEKNELRTKIYCYTFVKKVALQSADIIGMYMGYKMI